MLTHFAQEMKISTLQLMNKIAECNSNKSRKLMHKLKPLDSISRNRSKCLTFIFDYNSGSR